MTARVRFIIVVTYSYNIRLYFSEGVSYTFINNYMMYRFKENMS
jgi:hypothetical protein